MVDPNRVVLAVVVAVAVGSWLLMPLELIGELVFFGPAYRIGLLVFRETRAVQNPTATHKSLPVYIQTENWRFKFLSTDICLCREPVRFALHRLIPVKCLLRWEGEIVTVEGRIPFSQTLFLGVLLLAGFASGVPENGSLLVAWGIAAILTIALGYLAFAKAKRANTVLDELQQQLGYRSTRAWY